MTLSEYVKQCIAADDHATATSFMLDTVLVSKFRDLRDQSELKVAEFGLNLFWNSVSGPITVGGNTYGGTKTAVDMKTGAVRHDPAYIGDCHTHPYEQKMGPEARLGPSTGDYMEWWYNPPSNFKIALHFVISSATIFLLMLRDKTARVGLQAKGNDIDAAFKELDAPDTQTLSVVQTKCMEDDGFNGEYVKAFGKDDYAAQHALYDRYFPNLAREFSAANLRMNLDLSRKLQFEYYVGEMDRRITALSTCQMVLKSEMVYGSFYAQAALAFSRNPTLL